jgi:hypothetical protein
VAATVVVVAVMGATAAAGSLWCVCSEGVRYSKEEEDDDDDEEEVEVFALFGGSEELCLSRILSTSNKSTLPPLPPLLWRRIRLCPLVS